MTPAEILRAARAKIAAPTNWCQGTYARDASGGGVPSHHWSARQWCSIGAVHVVSDYGNECDEAKDLLYAAAKQMRSMGPHVLNDERGHSAVMSMFSIAIALANQEEAR